MGRIKLGFKMKLKHYPSEKLKREILEIVERYLDLRQYEVFFFGSRVRDETDDRADIDIGIQGDQPLPSGVLEDIREELNNLPILYSIDVIDFSDVDKDFYRVAKQNVEIITK
ncbi:MAG: hypothetical protein DDT32_00127 [Syntrophomonadaceae bacterium]|nr:hypothetical protein [Bacillota bacterium]MBT9146401.1 hypothetical protein [Bacillota bacterium]